MAQYRSRWTGEVIDDAVDKVRKIAYINLNGNPQEAYEAAETAYSAGFDIIARYDRNMGSGTLIQSFELVCVLRQQTKNSSQQTSTYYWFRSFVTHTSLKLAFKLGCDYGSTTATLEDITATYQWEATQETLGIQEQSNDDIAEHDIPEGSYVYFKAGIAKAITNIAVGDTLRAVSPNRNLAWIPDGGLNDLKSALDAKADQTDLASIHATGTTNTTGNVIDAPTYFYLNGVLVQATTRINIGETFTLNTNYGVVTNGGLNQSSYTWFELTVTTSATGSADLLLSSGKVVRHAYCTSDDIVIIPVTSQGSRPWIKALNWDMTAYANKTITVKGTYWNS